ncbi:hypothetical protein BJ138DRAFT_1078982 [Hygrophoropsis aurantiaca]|uniref:Uncharacterized protein n=1 Tax=Hygrophoropsis aurantiaca TaxID=72124 RepID=A0ACB8AMH4_9AGAM|nr:hypothetical protein BJ138DRAFT_1078982 [Hygrophoropsis aurantiaca]
MSKRLASFRGPSTPTPSPVQQTKQNTPSSPSKSVESTFHRRIRTSLQELRSITQTWDDIVILDGSKALRILTNTRTELDNALALVPPGEQPRFRLIGPKLAIVDDCIHQLDVVTVKLQKQFRRMNAVIDNMEDILYEASKNKGYQWCCEEPLWVSWPLEKFVSCISDIIIPYHRSLDMHINLLDTLRTHSVSFEASRHAISQWVDQPCLQEAEWDTTWEDLCAVEVERWDAR